MLVQWDDNQKAIVRDLLIHGWPSLSWGDRSVILATLAPGSSATTLACTAHAEFWENMIALGWAERADMDLGAPFPGDIRVFRFNSEGRTIFPAFVDRFDLASVRVRADVPEVRAMLDRHVAEVAAEISGLSWSYLAERLPLSQTRVMPNKWDYYVAACWNAAWQDEAGGPIEIAIQGFLHSGHHNPIVRIDRIVRKRGLRARLFG
jgi:hypothetical protein